MVHRCRQHLLSGLTALFLLTTLTGVLQSSAGVAHAASTITVEPSLQYQTLQGWGTSLAWWANIIGGWSDSQRTSLANALYDTTDGIGLNAARYNFGADGPGNVCHNQMKEGRNVPSFEPTQGNYVWTNDANQLWFAQAAQARGANIFEGFVNSAPAWMLDNSCTAGGAGGAENLNPAHYNDFATYMATIAQYFHDSFGITLQTIAPFNEPSGTWWTSGGSQEGMAVSKGTQNTIIPLVASALAQNGAAAYTAVSSSDDNTVTEAVNDYNSYASSTKSAMAQWNTHSYGGSDADRNNAYANIGQGDGKRLWMSEWGIGSQGSPINAALALSHQILDDEQHLHPVTWVGWQAVNEAGATDPDDVWGLAYRDSNNTISYPSRYYAMGNYSKFLRPGYTMIGNSDANTFTAYNASTHSLVIVATNSSTSSTSTTYNLANFSSVGSIATPYQTSASENLAQLADVSIANKTFSSSLPAQSITTFVIPNVTYANTNSGYYEIVNNNSGQLLDVSGGSTTAGANVIQWTSNGGTNQQWSLVPVNGYEQLVNRNSGQLLDVSNASTTAGANVIQWTNNGGANQQWSLVAVGGGVYEIVNRHSRMVLDVSGGSTTAGASVIQWTNNGGTNQQWSLVPV
jgi:O-glycosyl hydrolase